LAPRIQVLDVVILSSQVVLRLLQGGHIAGWSRDVADCATAAGNRAGHECERKGDEKGEGNECRRPPALVENGGDFGHGSVPFVVFLDWSLAANGQAGGIPVKLRRSTRCRIAAAEWSYP
jgi:hypothetical protein